MFTEMTDGLFGGNGNGYVWCTQLIPMDYENQDTDKTLTYTATQDCIVVAKINLWNYGYNAYAQISFNDVLLKTYQNIGSGTTNKSFYREVFNLKTGDKISIVMKSHQTGETNNCWYILTQFTP